MKRRMAMWTVAAVSMLAAAGCKKTAKNKPVEISAAPVVSPTAADIAPAAGGTVAPAPAAPAPAVMAPTNEQAVLAARTWLLAVQSKQPDAIAAASAIPFWLQVAHSHGRDNDRCKSEGTTLTDVKAFNHGCLVEIVDYMPKTIALEADAVKTSVDDAILLPGAERDALLKQPAGNLLVTFASPDEGPLSATLEIRIIDGKPRVTGAVLQVELVDD